MCLGKESDGDYSHNILEVYKDIKSLLKQVNLLVQLRNTHTSTVINSITL